jgi:hypothetical protein
VPRVIVVAAALVAAALFGGGDQYLGSLSWHPWAADVSVLSAPWLVLAFLAGCTQRDPRRAALLGLACTISALIGYGLMTLSPVEGAELTARTVSGFARSESSVLVGGIFTGPLFGWFGQRWRADRAWAGALVTAALVCIEPLARTAVGDGVRFQVVWMGEIAVGLAMATYVVAMRRRGEPIDRR